MSKSIETRSGNTPDLPKWLQGIGLTITDVLYYQLKQIDKESVETLQQANERLLQGDSILVISNHPSNLQTLLSTNTAIKHLEDRNPNHSSILVTDKFFTGEKGLIGLILLDLFAKKGIKTRPIMQGYRYSPAESTKQNTKSLREVSQDLQQPSGLAILYPEGTRNPTLSKLEDGWYLFAKQADWTLPIITQSKPGNLSTKIQTLKPINRETILEFRQIFKKNAREVCSSWMGTKMALCLPPGQRGYYENMAALVEGITQPIESHPLQYDVLKAFKHFD